MGYFNTPENKRVDVVRVIGGVLGFSHEELDKVWVLKTLTALDDSAAAPPKLWIMLTQQQQIDSIWPCVFTLTDVEMMSKRGKNKKVDHKAQSSGSLVLVTSVHVLE